MAPFSRIGVVVWFVALLALPLSEPALSQEREPRELGTIQNRIPLGQVGGELKTGSTDLAGEWGMRFFEEHEDRIPGPTIGEYMGIPLSEAGLAYAETFDPNDQGLPEFQCRSHSTPYQWRGAGPTIRIRKEISQAGGNGEGRQLFAYHISYTRPGDRVIYLDGRAHPPEPAPHFWSGFSTGTFEGNTLVIETSHLKQGSIKRNGVYYSDEAKVKEWLIRHGDFLTVVSSIQDPTYLTEPFLQSVTFKWEPHMEVEYFPCTVTQENSEDRTWHFLPGQNPYARELSQEEGIPYEATRGGAETMYPEYRKKLKQMMGSK
jgi:hypothetical protein